MINELKRLTTMAKLLALRLQRAFDAVSLVPRLRVLEERNLHSADVNDEKTRTIGSIRNLAQNVHPALANDLPSRIGI